MENNAGSLDAEAVAAALVSAGLYPATLRELKRAAIENALRVANGNQAHAAKSLGISVRTLRRKIRRWRDEPN